MSDADDFAAWAGIACRDFAAAAREVEASALDAFADEIVGARRIALHGLGREGLMMRALTMRLFHLGLQASPVGDMATPPFGAGDLLVVSAGPGAFETIGALMGIARDAGARVVLLTAEAAAPLRGKADRVLLIPARTMMSPGTHPPGEPSIFTMGSAYEAMLFLASEYLVGRLAQRLGATEAQMRARHTNLE